MMFILMQQEKILQNIYVIPGSTITDVAELCFVSMTTISDYAEN